MANFDPKKHVPKINYFFFFTVKDGSIGFEGLKVFILKDMTLIVKIKFFECSLNCAKVDRLSDKKQTAS